jgi:hypothetical protein
MVATLAVIEGGLSDQAERLPTSGSAFSDLEAWASCEEAMGLPLSDVEDEVVSRGREALRLLLQEHIDKRAEAESVEDAVQIKGVNGQVLLSHHLIRTRKQRTTLGPVAVERVGYGYPGESTVFPLDENLQLPALIYSYPLQKHLVRGAVRGPFQEAVSTVEEYTGEKVPKRSVESLLEGSAVDFEAFYAQRKVALPHETSEIVVATADCKGVPMIPGDRTGPSKDGGDQKGIKRMAVVTATYTVAPRPRTPEDVMESLLRDPTRPKVVQKTKDARPEGKRVSASLSKTKDELIQEMAADVEGRDPNKSKTRVAITDGERALKKRVLKLIPGAILILDLLHALGYLRTAGNLLFPEDRTAASAWIERQLLQVLKGRVSLVVRGLRQSITKRKIIGKAQKTLLGAAAYLYNNRHHMAYHDYLAKGYPIASGAVEGACKSIVGDRMERSGMLWSEATAEPLLQLRSIYLSDDFDEYWAFHVECEQARLHPKGAWVPVEYVDQK